MKILGTGMTGLVGSRIAELLKDRYAFEFSDVDITDKKKIIDKISSSDAPIVLHMAAKTNVDGCEKDKDVDKIILKYKDIKKQEKAWRDKKTAWGVNVFGTRNVVEACRKNNKKLIFISTGFVFNGKKKLYREGDRTGAISWYGKTKEEGEKIVRKSDFPWLIVRIDYPYRANFEKTDFVRFLLKKIRKGEKLQMVTDHIMCPTFIDDIPHVLDILIKKKSEGIYHAVGSQALSPYEAACRIADVFEFKTDNIGATTRKKFFKNRAQRPFHLALENGKIQKLGVRMKTFDEGLKEIKKQIDSFSS